MKNTTLESIVENIKKDLSKASSKEIDTIYSKLKILLKKYDNDNIFKNFRDILKSIFRPKRDKCVIFFEDLTEGIDSMSPDDKEELRKELLDLSNIHRDILENVIGLLEAL